jgi:hypothetical protein
MKVSAISVGFSVHHNRTPRGTEEFRRNFGLWSGGKGRKIGSVCGIVKKILTQRRFSRKEGSHAKFIHGGFHHLQG